MTNQFKGIKASSGISFAKALLFTKEEIVIRQQLISEYSIEEEQQLYNNAVEKSRKQIEKLIKNAKLSLGEDI
jgi:phosphoenolpyruvate-protein kinase (PTS system EI component)